MVRKESITKKIPKEDAIIFASILKNAVKEALMHARAKDAQHKKNNVHSGNID